MSHCRYFAPACLATLFTGLLAAPQAGAGPEETTPAQTVTGAAAVDEEGLPLTTTDRDDPSRHALSNLWNLRSRYELDDEGNWIIVSRPLSLSSQQRQQRLERQARQVPGFWEQQRYGTVYTPSRSGNAPAAGTPSSGTSPRGDRARIQRSSPAPTRRSTTQPRRVTP